MTFSTSPRHKLQALRQDRIGFRRFVVACVVFATLVFPVGVAGAKEYTAARKAGRGLAAMTCAFLEIPGNIVQETQTHGTGPGIAIGFTLGVGNMVLRTLVGVFELVTSPFPVPDGFKPIIQPEFPWDYFDEPNS
jgi:putative exosortase-associated protein (TIGR04073 family)